MHKCINQHILKYMHAFSFKDVQLLLVTPKSKYCFHKNEFSSEIYIYIHTFNNENIYLYIEYLCVCVCVYQYNKRDVRLFEWTHMLLNASMYV